MSEVKPYKITDIPGLEGVEAIDLPYKLSFPQAVISAASKNMWPATGTSAFLQSSREAICAKRLYEYQLTRTYAMYTRLNDGYYVAIDDCPGNILLTIATQANEIYKRFGKFLLPTADPLIKEVIKHASERTFRLRESPLELATGADNSPFGQSEVSQAIFGDVSAIMSKALYHRNCRFVRFWFLTPEELELNGVNNDHIEIRPVSLLEMRNTCLIVDSVQFGEGSARSVRNPCKFKRAA